MAQPAACYFARVVPTQSIQFVKTSGMKGPIINEYGMGNYLVYRLYPRVTVSMNSRIDAYGRHFAERNLNALNGGFRGFRDLPEHMIAYPPKGERPSDVDFVRDHPNWKVVYRDEIAIIYSRDRNLWPEP